MQEFEGELVPKEISLKWSPLWIQIYNLPLKCKTSGLGHEIGLKIREVIEVDVLENGVQWGMYLRMRVSIDTTKKLVWGNKVSIVGGEGRWVFFKYEWLPKFCYKCGMLDHGEKECPKKEQGEDCGSWGSVQYGLWIRGEPGRHFGREAVRMDDGGWLNNKNREEGMEKKLGTSPKKSTKVGQKTGVGGKPMIGIG